MTRMQRHAWHLVAFAAAIVAASTVALVRAAPRLPVTFGQLTPNGSDGAAEPLRPVERAFILESVQNGRDEAELSRLAVSQATASSVRDLAQQMVGDYRGINTALETLARRKAVSLPLQPTSFGDRYRDLAGAGGKAFDRAFIREIVAANQRALRLCESAVANARDPDIRELAGNLLPVIRDHVNKSIQLERDL